MGAEAMTTRYDFPLLATIILAVIFMGANAL